MRTEPSWRIPVGMIALLIGLTAYALILARYLPEIIGGWHVGFQTVVYVILGVIWLLPLRKFLSWMETGSIHPPEGDK